LKLKTSGSPQSRMSCSTGGKSRESEEESADRRQKTNLIPEQSNEEAGRSAAAPRVVLNPGGRVNFYLMPNDDIMTGFFSHLITGILFASRSGKGTIADLLEARNAVTISKIDNPSSRKDRARVVVLKTGRKHTDVPRAFTDMVKWLADRECGRDRFQHIVHPYIL